MIIPKPSKLVIENGCFSAGKNLKILYDTNNTETAAIAAYLSDYLKRPAGTGCETADYTEKSPDGATAYIALRLSPETVIDQPEGYELEVDSKSIIIKASKPAGLFYGVQTICKLIRPDKTNSSFTAPCLRISDSPVFKWRGMLLDCSRHFIRKEYIKHFIDTLSQLKMNVFHWHLTDDHGWRIEIKQYPQLTQTGSFIENGEAREGFYTKEDIKEIVEYAKSRYIEVIPEFDIPGHSFAVMKSLPWLCCTGEPVRNKGHQRDLYCAGKKETLEFLKDVLDEIIELFPSNYVHLGGDEAPKERWAECPACQKVIKEQGLKDENELQGYLLRQVADYLRTKGRTAICWDEALECGIDTDTVVHWWRNIQLGNQPEINALKEGHSVICSPNSLTYLSFPVDPDENFKPLRTSDLEKVYSAEHIPQGLTEEEKSRIMGIECCIWTEHLTDIEIDRMLYPRILAISELSWAYPEKRDLNEFLERIYAEQKRLEAEGIKFGPFFKTFVEEKPEQYNGTDIL